MQQDGAGTTDSITLADNGGDSLSVTPMGGKFTLMLGNTPVLVDVVRGDGKAIRTHLCTPNFGRDMSGTYGLAQHGNMRNEPCRVARTGDLSVRVTHDITDSPGRYPTGGQAAMDLTLSDGAMTVEVRHGNSGTAPIPVNAGIHCYFNAPRGYAGTKINGRDVSEFIETTGSVDLAPENIVEIPGMPRLRVKQAGFPKAVLWVGQNDTGTKDGTYVCIEPVEGLPDVFGSATSMIAPGTNRSGRLEFALA
jgi:galactose mutarotase-like enzyme